MKQVKNVLSAVILLTISAWSQAQVPFEERVFEAGHASLQDWILPEEVPAPQDNKLNPERAELGKMLFFDPRLSGDKNMSCATCHSPMFGWSDGLPTAKGNKSMVLQRASPVITNTGYNSIQMWDGRKSSLEDQALGPMMANEEMNMNLTELVAFLSSNSEYSNLFANAYPDESVGEVTLAKALASFERTVVSRNSPFDQWVQGDSEALTPEQIEGFKVFTDPNKGNCEVCHSSPNFTDNGFHNLGLASWGDENPDVGRYTQRPLGLMKGAFKTPTIRDITLSGPYFHDGSATTLKDVVEHYVKGGVVKTNIAPNFKPANLTESEVQDLLVFMEALTSKPAPFTLPVLPLNH
jgi:cytochrome c peroxidase